MKDRNNRRELNITERRLSVSNWIFLSVVYAFIFALLSGIIIVYLPDIIYVWNTPIDVGQGIWMLGISLWGIITIIIKTGNGN